MFNSDALVQELPSDNFRNYMCVTLMSLEAAAAFPMTQEHFQNLGRPHKLFPSSWPMRTQRGPARSFPLHRAQGLRGNLYHSFLYPSLSYLILQFNLFQENTNLYFNSLVTHSVLGTRVPTVCAREHCEFS